MHRQCDIGGARELPELLRERVVHPEAALEVDLTRCIPALDESLDGLLGRLARRHPCRTDSDRRAHGSILVARCDCLSDMKATMLLADYAVVADGKLTIVGGGWSQTGPEAASFGIGLLIQVPWDQANTRHTFSVELLDADGAPIAFDEEEQAEQIVAFGGEFEVGRPPGLKPGTPLDFPVAVNSTPLPLEPGRYEWRLTIDDTSREDWRMPFTVRSEET